MRIISCVRIKCGTVSFQHLAAVVGSTRLSLAPGNIRYRVTSPSVKDIRRTCVSCMSLSTLSKGFLARDAPLTY